MGVGRRAVGPALGAPTSPGQAGLGCAGLALVMILAGCARADSGPTPGELSFESQITFDGSYDPDRPRPAGEASGGVIVGHVVGDSMVAREGPSADADVVAELTNPTEVGGALVVQLVDDEVAPRGDDDWVEVRLPIRPNGSTGWVPVDQLELSRNQFRIEIDTGDHRLEVWRGSERWLETSVAIGTGATPTPRGEFYVIELLQPPDPTGLYGPFAFGLSGFSETLRSFRGGDGVIGIHGTDEPEALGTDVSHGCVRVDNEVITAMAGMIPLGTPVVITD